MKTTPMLLNVVGGCAYAAWMFGAQGASPIPHPWVVGPAIQFLLMLLDFMSLGRLLPHHVLMSVAQSVLLTNGLCDMGVSTELTCKYSKQIPEYVIPVALFVYAAMIYNFKGANVDVLAQLVGTGAAIGGFLCSNGLLPVKQVCNIVARVKDPAVFLPRCFIFGSCWRVLRFALDDDDDEFDEDE